MRVLLLSFNGKWLLLHSKYRQEKAGDGIPQSGGTQGQGSSQGKEGSGKENGPQSEEKTGLEVCTY